VLEMHRNGMLGVIHAHLLSMAQVEVAGRTHGAAALTR
jgi:hypothetical protein